VKDNKDSTQERPHFQELTKGDFARLFGTTQEDIETNFSEKIAGKNFRYRIIEGSEHDEVLRDILKAVDSGELTLAGPEGKRRWEKGWSENLKDLENCNFDVSQLVPKYIRQKQPVRLDQNYVMPEDPQFELNWYSIFREWFFTTYLKDVENIYEFGCGSGFNLVVLANLFPEKRLFGMDWAGASRDIVNKLSAVFGWKMEGHIFDFFTPDYNLIIAPNSAVLTIGALEQTGKNFEAFLQYVLSSNPSICTHIEPICEWYDDNVLVDHAAIKFHRARKYWEGFPDRLQQLANEGRVEILKRKRSFFGSLFLEGYSQIIWRPVGR
jgi:hypothetical protein